MQQVLYTMQQVLYGMQQVCEFFISYIEYVEKKIESKIDRRKISISPTANQPTWLSRRNTIGARVLLRMRIKILTLEMKF